MRIWIDADSIARKARDLLRAVAARHGVVAVFVANRVIETAGTSVESVTTRDADGYIAANGAIGDLAITRDIPLARRLVASGLAVMNDEGRVYTTDNVRERESIRDFMLFAKDPALRSNRSAAEARKALHAFANALDRFFAQRCSVNVSDDAAPRRRTTLEVPDEGR